MLVYGPTLSGKSGDYISDLILGQNKEISGLMLIVTSSKIQGFINTCTLSDVLSASELYNLSECVKMKMCPWRQDIKYYGDNITFVETLLNNYDWHLQISLLDGDTIVIHNTDFSKLTNTDMNLLNLVGLVKLHIFGSNITDETADNIASVISRNINLQKLKLCSSILQPSGILKILLNILSLKKLYINDNNITCEAADDIAAVIACNFNLQEFDISENNLQTAGIIKVMKALKGINTLRKLYISNNNITDDVTDNIAAVISFNLDMEVLDISGNSLQTEGAIKIGNFIQNIHTPKTLFIINHWRRKPLMIGGAKVIVD